MSFPRYTQYKPSGVKWIGDLPSHWSIAPLKWSVDPKRRITYGIVQAGPHVQGGVPYIRPADMSEEAGPIDLSTVLRTDPSIAASYSRSVIREGDLVCSIGPSFGKLMVTPSDLDGANLTQGTARIAVSREYCSKFVFWSLRSMNSVAQWESSIGGATFRALNLEPLAETRVPIPSPPEQRAIAQFLDRETAKIDALIEEQEKFIVLLKERRSALISAAVTGQIDVRNAVPEPVA